MDFHDDLDNDNDDDLIDDDIIDEEVQLEMQKQAVERAVSFDSESVSNASPMPNQKKIRSMRHAATLAADGHGPASNHVGVHEHRSQTFETEQKPKTGAPRGSSHPLGSSHTGKINTTKKTKLMAV